MRIKISCFVSWIARVAEPFVFSVHARTMFVYLLIAGHAVSPNNSTWISFFSNLFCNQSIMLDMYHSWECDPAHLTWINALSFWCFLSRLFCVSTKSGPILVWTQIPRVRQTKCNRTGWYICLPKSSLQSCNSSKGYELFCGWNMAHGIIKEH